MKPQALLLIVLGLQIDTDVEIPKMWIAWSGLALLLVGFGILVRDAVVRSRKRL